MKTAVIGSRSFSNYPLMKKTLDEFNISLIISGGATGADHLAEQYAKDRNIPTQIFLPDYKRYKRGATFQRNKQIIFTADQILAFWNGESKGTRYTIQQAEKAGKKVHIIRYSDSSEDAFLRSKSGF